MLPVKQNINNNMGATTSPLDEIGYTQTAHYHKARSGELKKYIDSKIRVKSFAGLYKKNK